MISTKDGQLKSRLDGADVFAFTGQSKLYAKYRPRYPQCIIDLATSKVNLKKIALDVGCGPGILTIPLAKIFEKVVGIDVSQDQIDNAVEKSKGIENISYFYQDSHDMEDFVHEKLNDEKIDFVSIAQTLHWLNYDIIFESYKKYLSEKGVIAVFSYSTCQIMNQKMVEKLKDEISGGNSRFIEVEILNFDEEKKYAEEDLKANEAFNTFYQIVKPHFECNREHLDKYFDHVPYKDYFGSVEQYLKYEVKKMSLMDFLLYLKTMSGFRCYLKKFPGDLDPLENLRKEVSEIYSLGSKEEIEEKQVDIVFPYYLAVLKY